MPTPFPIEITLPNDPNALRIARACVREIVDMADFAPEEGGPLIDAAVEACANVLDHAFAPGETGTFTLRTELTPTQVTIAVRDQGIPFVDELEEDHAQSPEASPNRLSASGGMNLIRQAVDHAEWINLGKAGKEVRLVKRRTACEITDELQEGDLARIAEDAPLAPEQEYEIRLLRPEDAVGVSQCIYRTYGYTYLHEDCYYPERIARQNETGELVSVVAVDAGGAVVGHYALERPQMVRVAERGMAVVSPEHRGRDLMGRMRVFIEEEARRRGLVGVFSMAVTHHVYSQKVNEEFDSRVTGVLLAGSARDLVFKKMQAQQQPQRISWVLYYTYVIDPPVAVVHAPARHRDMLARIYDNLGIAVEWRDGATAAGQGEVEVSYSHSWDSGTIKVHRAGADSAVEIRRACRDLCSVTGAEVVYLELPLAQSGTPDLCRAAEECGFFFAGVGPSFSRDGDALLMQYLNVPLDTSLIKLANPFARELLAYIDGERAAAGSGAG